MKTITGAVIGNFALADVIQMDRKALPKPKRRSELNKKGILRSKMFYWIGRRA